MKDPFYQSPASEPGKRYSDSPAFALISTLLIIAVLTIMVIAFMQSMRVDRLTARSYMSMLNASLAAESGINAATQKIKLQMTDTNAGGAAYTTWAYFTNAADTNVFYSAITVGRPVDNYALTNFTTNWLSVTNTTWLFSDDVKLGAYTNLANPDSLGTNTVNLNYNNRFFRGSTNVPVPWQEYSKTTNGGRVEVLRFAYWVEDESARLNFNAIGNTNGAGGTSLRGYGTNVSEIQPFDLVATNIAKFVPQKGRILTPGTVRQIYATDTTMQALDNLITTYSAGTDVIQYGPAFTAGGDTNRPWRGKLRMNLNYSGHTDTNSTPELRVNRLADWMQYGAPSYFTNGAAQYFTNTVGTNEYQTNRREMLNTIAASIIDSLDADGIPTQPTSTSTVVPDPRNLTTPPAPVSLMANTTRPAFFGVDSSPVLNEVSIVWNYDPAKDVSSPKTYQAATALNRTLAGGIYTYKIPVTLRFELWNMSNKPIAARNYSVRGYYQQQIRSSAFGFGADGAPTNTENIYDLGSLSFAAGEIKATEVTTTYTCSGPTDLGTTWAELIKGPDHLAGTTAQNTDNEPDGHTRASFVLYEPSTGKWLSPTCYVDGIESPPTGVTTSGPGNMGASQGNRINDPRMSPLRVYAPASVSTTALQGDRDWSSNGGGNIGFINNIASRFYYQDLDFWMDRPKFVMTPSTALLEPISKINDGPFKNTGELGNIFDPGWSHPRGRGTDSDLAENFAYRTGAVSPFRGGGSLRIGQPGNNPVLAANSWALMDLFTASQTVSNLFQDSAWQGKVNINFPKSVIQGATTYRNLDFVFKLPALDNPGPDGSGTNFDSAQIFTDIKNRLRAGGSGGVGGAVITSWKSARPFFSTGELSESTIWQTPGLYNLPASPAVTVSETPVSATLSTDKLKRLNRSDRGREEIFSRSSDLITTQGGSFRIYVIGQYLSGPASGASTLKVQSTKFVEISEMFQPIFNPDTGELLRVDIRKNFELDR